MVVVILINLDGMLNICWGGGFQGQLRTLVCSGKLANVEICIKLSQQQQY